MKLDLPKQDPDDQNVSFQYLDDDHKRIVFEQLLELFDIKIVMRLQNCGGRLPQIVRNE